MFSVLQDDYIPYPRIEDVSQFFKTQIYTFLKCSTQPEVVWRIDAECFSNLQNGLQNCSSSPTKNICMYAEIQLGRGGIYFLFGEKLKAIMFIKEYWYKGG